MTTATVRGVRHATDRRGRGAVVVPLALLAGAAFLVSVRWHPGGPLVGRAVDDTGQLVAAAIAAWCTGLRARAAQRTGSPAALAWAL